MEQRQLNELLLQSLEQELGGVQVYQAAIRCAANDELKEEWETYLDQTEHHVEILQGVFAQMQLDPEQQSPGRMIVHNLGAALVAAMEAALGAGDPAAAQLVAAECVTLAETKDHMDWELLGEASKKLAGPQRKALEEACDEVEDQEDEHLYHTRGWARELWMEALGLKAVLPPPEERKDVKTAIGAARAQQERGAMT
jgi:F0F1-type ATP synthase membrane subunit b/b'